MNIIRSLALGLAASTLLGACAASGEPSSTPRPGSLPPIVEQSGSGYYFRLSNDGGPAIAEFDEPIGRVWSVLAAAYETVGVEIGTLDPASRTVGNRTLTVTRRLGTMPVAQVVNCSGGGFGVSAATGYRVQMSVLSTLSPTQSGGTRMETLVDASGTPVEGGSRATLPCPSTGRLEQRLAESVQRSLGP